jgi:hypothetical protein
MVYASCMKVLIHHLLARSLTGFQRYHLRPRRCALLGFDPHGWSGNGKRGHAPINGFLLLTFRHQEWSLLVEDSSIPFIVIIVGGCGVRLTGANAAIWFLSIGLRRADYAVVIRLQSANVDKKAL